ncbi:ribosome small subunit-dependent GTPase A [Candidatus Pseudothioglobus singularis]|uniref:Small ribosomal subunit biogenesis GTPase RsgA n=1 Tax=Candidatus Pseudothioglobus singularis PS1 TaxID=1125411 RepID=A0A0M3T214_9GAMM|nr:ribosome small subunit-dependent GTPase A [Candidatus Pseudothioglobus singularis]ALE01965.1 ribosome small subunit-dependent GTPase A [Candidatus Pseudothioglobus singularis PS1]
MPLTRKQKWRIDKVQSEKIARADKASIKAESELNVKDKEYSGKVITRYGQRQLVEAKNGEIFQCVSRQNIGFSVAGDEVLFKKTKQGEAIVTAIYPRRTELQRKDKLIAANIDQLWLVVAIEPHYEFDLIDRYLIMAENSNLPIGIVINKIELLKNKSQLNDDFEHYRNIGYDVHIMSVKSDLNVISFKEKLVNKSHIFLGQSGVGKSSLINALIPDLELRVNEISIKSKLGKHTTTNTTIYHIPSGGDLIDSPGVREFQLDNLSEEQIVRGFREFKALSHQCRFRNCKHINEPDCAIKMALENGEINSNRYESYLNILA